MKVNLINNSPYFGKLLYRNKPMVETALKGKPELKEYIEQAVEELKDTKHEMVIYSNDGNMLSHHVEVGEDQCLTYIDCAEKSEESPNILRVFGFVYDIVAGYRSIDYNECEITFKDENNVTKYEQLINSCDDENREIACLKRDVIVTKALDEE